MKVLLNTSFFFSPQVAAQVRSDLRERWIPACCAAGDEPPTCLRMSAEDGIERLAVQTPFFSEEGAAMFLREIASPIAEEMTRRYGIESFTSFSTLMEIVEL